MAAKSPTIDANTIEREIVARLRAAKLRPRFDKVALPLVSELKAALASVVPEGQSVVFTISAPIRLPAKTAAALANMARSSPATQSAVRSCTAPRFESAGWDTSPSQGPRCWVSCTASNRTPAPSWPWRRRGSSSRMGTSNVGRAERPWRRVVSRGPRRTLSSSRKSRSFRDESCSTIRRRTPSEARAGAA